MQLFKAFVAVWLEFSSLHVHLSEQNIVFQVYFLEICYYKAITLTLFSHKDRLITVTVH